MSKVLRQPCGSALSRCSACEAEGMSIPNSIPEYLRFGAELGDRIVQMFPALYKPGDPVSPRMRTLLRKPYPAQEVAAMSVVKRWEEARSAAVIAECGTGKTLVALAAVHCHSEGKPYTALALVPGHLTAKTAREAFQTLPGVPVFFIEPCAIMLGTAHPAALTK